MSSILTNNGAMVALQTLSSINSNLTDTQAMISTGKKVGSAKDNASVWAISKVMESDVQGFKGISDSLSLGQSTVAVARQASESVTDLLTQIKAKVVASQEQNVDRNKIQTDIKALTDQIKSVTNAAQFNGLNLIKGTDDVTVLSSLDRASNGAVTASDITVNRHDLSTDAGVYGAGTSLAANISASEATVDSSGAQNQVELTLAGSSGDALSLNINGSTVSVAWNTDAATTIGDAAGAINALGLTGITATDGGSGKLEIANTNAFQSFDVSWDAGGTNTVALNNVGTGGTAAASTAAGTTTLVERAEGVTLSTSAKVNDGDSYRISVNGNDYNYIAGKGETMKDVAAGLKAAVDAGAETGVSTQVSQDETTGAWSVKVDYDGTDTTAGSTMTLAVNGAADGTASGGLFGLDNINVATDQGAKAALGNVETLINNAIDAAASFGSSQSRISTQSDFIGKLTDSLKSGIGSLVDANMEEASARLQALQVQQQLGVQSLSIANKAPQSILSLFR
ncbi:MAG: flagellin [Limimaricola sp.]|uniref:flagellin N-terminal helical domain-containing protein n=1 Tax=Limimaricola sp. TaxID=2211665 RepID=UPI001D3FB7EF|nr:flagellin [Limimaricola sp.]MBI1417328.1 flagellin [Limimaricola sp.]